MTRRRNTSGSANRDWIPRTVQECFDPERFIRSHNHLGGTAPEENARLLKERRGILDAAAERQRQRLQRKTDGLARLDREADRIRRGRVGMQNPDSIENRLSRWKAFVNEGKGSFMFHVQFPLPEMEDALPPPVPLWPEHAQERIERAWAEYELSCHKAERVPDDRVPFLSNLTGTEIFAEAFGCGVHRPDNTKPFALALVKSASEADAIETPELSTSSLAYLFDIADELYRRGGPGAVMKPVDIQSPMDIVALIWDKADLFCAMIDAPDSVRHLAAKVRSLLTAFMDEWFRRYGTTFVAHYPDYVMHGGITMSVDEVGAVSEDMFRDFFRDELVELSTHFGGLGIHCCADARHQWGNFRALPGLKVMNHNAPPTRDAREYLLDAVRFYGNDVVQVPRGWTPDGDPATWPMQFPEGARLALDVPAEDLSAAMTLASRLHEIREKLDASGSQAGRKGLLATDREEDKGKD